MWMVLLWMEYGGKEIYRDAAAALRIKRKWVCALQTLAGGDWSIYIGQWMAGASEMMTHPPFGQKAVR